MPEVTDDFITAPIGYFTSRGGAAVTDSTTINMDTSAVGTGQTLTNAFAIPSAPEGSPDDLWDEITFTLDWESANSIIGAGADEARVAVGLTPSNSFTGITFPYGAQNLSMVSEAEATVSVQNGTATVTFTNVAPGTYRLFFGEPNVGDGERLLLSVTGGQAVELVPCFNRGTQIQTVNGQVAIEDLSIGTLVSTKNGPKPICWIGSRQLSAEILAANPKLRPICIRAGALGNNLPADDLIVSPQHRILIRSSIAQRMFGVSEVLVAAKQLLELDGVDIAEDMPEVEYFHIMLDQHEIIISNGAESESLYAGKQALAAIGEAARKEIFTIFPELETYSSEPDPAAMLISGRRGRQLAKRHKTNAKPLAEL